MRGLLAYSVSVFSSLFKGQTWCQYTNQKTKYEICLCQGLYVDRNKLQLMWDLVKLNMPTGESYYWIS